MEKQTKNKIITHLLAWGTLFVVFTTAQTMHGDAMVVVQRNLLIMCVQAMVFYLNLFVLMPALLEKKKHFFYAGGIIGTIAAAIFILHMGESIVIGRDEMMDKMQDVLRHERMPEFKRKILRNGHKIMQGVSMFGVLFISALVRSVELRSLREKENTELKSRAVEAESKFLKSQINPHFLFNALNNIYALSQMQSPKTPASIHQLSQMLRYVLYESDVEKVFLVNEVEYIKNYIGLQLLKDESIDTIAFDLNCVEGSLKVVPMLLIPFIENSFKHSNFENDGWIKLDLKTTGSILVLNISNSKPNIAKVKDEVGGVGLENVKHRLELAYKDRYQLDVVDHEIYSVKLKIELDEA